VLHKHIVFKTAVKYSSAYHIIFVFEPPCMTGVLHTVVK